MKTRLLHIFTRTPLHVGAGTSVGAIDQPVVRERHTGFPIIPASSLKGTFADAWNNTLLADENENGERTNVRVDQNGTRTDAAWLFGSDSDKFAAAGSLQFSEARLLAFPIRSARGSFAWITSPLALRRALRDGVFSSEAKALIEGIRPPADDSAIFAEGKLDLAGGPENPGKQIVLEEYAFSRSEGDEAEKLASIFAQLMPNDPVWQEIAGRLVIVSDGMMSFFVRNACEIAQHVRINDKTGTADGGALFNQENVPSETLFYSVLHALDERSANSETERRKAGDALHAFSVKLENPLFQFGGDASTGLGYCTVQISETKGA